MKRDIKHDRDPRDSEQATNLLVWLPSPMGDAILSTPALRAIRQHYSSRKIWFYAGPVVQEVLSPCRLNDEWLEAESSNPLASARRFREYKFTQAILLKNSLASALAVFVAGIPSRIGYVREGRGLLLTDKLYPPRLPNGKYKPRCMVDYYLDLASRLGADSSDKSLELPIDPVDIEALNTKLPELTEAKGSIVILVPWVSK